MNGILFRTLALGYGLAATAAAGLAYAGAGATAIVLTTWLGGGAISFGLSALVAAQTRAGQHDDDAPQSVDNDAPSETLLAEAMRQWEVDRTTDCEAPARSDRIGAAR